MSMTRHQRNWDTFAQLDSKWAILTCSDKKYGRWDEEEFFRTGQREIDAFLARTAALGIDLPRGQALDFGCGIGRLTRALGRYFQGVTGVDVSADMIHQARAHHVDTPHLSFVHNPHPHLACFPDETFDLAYSFITLQHVPGRAAVENYLREFIRILKPGGLLYFQLPSVSDYTPWRSALLKVRGGVFNGMVRLGVSPRRCFSTLRLAPYMHMTHIPSRVILDLLMPQASLCHLDNDRRTDTQYFFIRHSQKA